MKRVLVIGAGASGLVAAIEAARLGAKVTVVEKNNKIGKKLLATGNGRCNMTNYVLGTNNYRSNNLTFVEDILKLYETETIREYFKELSLWTRDVDGYVYPNTLQAASVVDKITKKCYELGVKIALDTECVDIDINENNEFAVKTANYTYIVDKVIVASGLVSGVDVKGNSVKKQDVLALKIAEKFGHKVYPVVPGLTGLKCNNKFLNKASGVRWNTKVSTYVENECIYSDEGELQFADYGISGIVVFQNSRYVTIALSENKKVEIILDFMPEYTMDEFEALLKQQVNDFNNMSIYDILSGMFNSKLVDYILLNANINPKEKVANLMDLKKLVAVIKEHIINVTESRGFEFSQVCAGGIDTSQICISMESKIKSGLYFTGEALDVDGMCGGYNLHFAFASGIQAGKSAGSGE